MTRQVEVMHDEQVRRWQAQIAHFEGVKGSFERRRADLQAEIDKWTAKLDSLEEDYAKADSEIARIRNLINDAERLKRQNASLRAARASGAPVRTKESKVSKARRLQLELAKLQREIELEGGSL